MIRDSTILWYGLGASVAECLARRVTRRPIRLAASGTSVIANVITAVPILATNVHYYGYTVRTVVFSTDR